MKNFLEIFIGSIILCWGFLTFGGYIIFENIWALIFLIAFIFAILVSAFIHHETKLEEMEARIKILESQPETKE